MARAASDEPLRGSMSALPRIKERATRVVWSHQVTMRSCSCTLRVTLYASGSLGAELGDPCIMHAREIGRA